MTDDSYEPLKQIAKQIDTLFRKYEEVGSRIREIETKGCAMSKVFNEQILQTKSTLEEIKADIRLLVVDIKDLIKKAYYILGGAAFLGIVCTVLVKVFS